MSFRISTNVQSLASQRHLGIQREAQNHQLEKLASGERIVRAADDAAGLAISEKLKAEIRSNRQAQRNANDGISMIQTAEGGLNELQNILVRFRELSVQAASDTVGDTERGFTDLEVQNLKQEVERISQTTRFNGAPLLNGEGGIYEFQVGTGPNPERDRLNYDSSQSDARLDTLGLGDLTVKRKEDAQASFDKIDAAITMVSANRANLGALQNRLQSTVQNLAIADENLSAANSRIRDADVASETAELTKRNILSSSSVSVLAQANQSGVMALKLIG